MQVIGKTLDQESRPKLDAVSLNALESIDEALKANWPGSGTGRLLGWSVERADSTPVLTVTHFAPALGPAGLELLASVTRSSTGENVRVREHVLPGQRVEAAASDGTSWLLQVTRLLAQASDFSDKLFFCFEAPTDDEGGTDATLQSLSAAMNPIPPGHRTLTRGERWSVKLSDSPCPSADEDGAAGAAAVAPTDSTAGAEARSRAGATAKP